MLETCLLYTSIGGLYWYQKEAASVTMVEATQISSILAQDVVNCCLLYTSTPLLIAEEESTDALFEHAVDAACLLYTSRCV